LCLGLAQSHCVSIVADSAETTGLKWATPAGGNPAGTVIFYAANAAPTGFLKANGAAVSRTTYADLFTAIGTTFGAGDGSTTFLVPDLRGRFARSWADDGSIDSGRAFGSNQEATSISDMDDGTVTESKVKNGDGTDGTINVNAVNVSTNRDSTYYKVRPVNTALLACIKF
jgi:microcystin-dependent protein